MKNKVYELMRRLNCANGYQIRLWIKTDENFTLDENLEINIIDFVKARLRFNPSYLCGKLCKEIAEHFEEEIAAVEVLNKQGDGNLCYNDWP